jgi:PAS domain S-box-containing protein
VALETTERIQAERARAEDALRESEALMRRAMEIETVGVIRFKATGEITYANEAFLRMSGYTPADHEAGLVRWDTMTPPEFMPPSVRAVAEFERYGRTTPYEKQYIRKDGSRWWALFFATRISEDEGLEYILDITERKEAEAALRESEVLLERRVEERTRELTIAVERLRVSEEALRVALAEQQALLREVNHRVKNNLEVVNSLLSLQADSIEEVRARQALSEAASRIRAIGVVHRLLYDAPRVAQVELGQFAGELAQALFASYGVTDDRVRFTVSGEAVHTELDQAVPLGLILNELLSNALLHAFPSGRAGDIGLQIDATGGVLDIADDGIGLPPTVDLERPGSLGLQLVQALMRQVGGTIQLVPGPGTHYRIQLPLTHAGGTSRSRRSSAS